ncbi:hypothetical protein GCM10022225_12850 [Plantactinospora mayteni]|uniref:Ricin B lectin domain-containing protein n=1 Tax=Plantactinospora mayteni TaxID=566021 RepID=A0ABQ4EIC2_9ACTN|nr:RICIN domain-containing protein [Plantactinospora mayteni]GIG93962.1 hypothetical protein Pma05_05350 [Plantactinospora mayteni]
MASPRTTPARIGRAGLVLALAAASTLVVGIGPAQAITVPVPEKPCGIDDLGRRAPEAATAVTTPTVTHFTAINVTGGTETEYEYTLEVTDKVITEVSKNVEVSTQWTIASVFVIGSKVGYTVKNVTEHTELERTRVLWRFLYPGYYALYKGTTQVTGALNSVHCSRVTLPDGSQQTQWLRRPGGDYKTFGNSEVGAVRCEDFYPPFTLRYAAQRRLCGPEPTTRPVGPTVPADGTEDVGTQAIPPEYTCEPGYYRFLTRNQMALYTPENENHKAVRLTAASSTSTRLDWQLCRTPGEYGEHLIIARGGGRCMDVLDQSFADEAEIEITNCHYGPSQRFVLYRDVAPSTAIGIQNVHSGSMLAPGGGSLANKTIVRQYSVGRDDASGTFYLQKVA